MFAVNAGWYLRRLQAMGLRELAWRTQDRLRQIYWSWRYYARSASPACREIAGEKRFCGGIARSRASQAPLAARAKAVAAADALLAGTWKTFRMQRHDLADPDWHFDASRRVGVPGNIYTFGIRTHGDNLGFDTKYVWELSRHHQTTLLAMAFWLTGEDAYARRATDSIDLWRRANPFLHGIHWTSSIEIGLRLIALTWTRRLLEDWPDTTARFDGDCVFRSLVYAHQWLLARRMSVGSSANNHLIYEACGLFVSSSAMPWFAESRDWRQTARNVLEREIARQTFPSGYNRELASDYNGFVIEAMAIALAEIALCGADPSPALAEIAARALHTLCDIVDVNGQPPHQGDGDDAHGLLLDAPDYDRWADLSFLGAAWFGIESQWPGHDAPSLRSWLLGGLVTGDGRRTSDGRHDLSASHPVIPGERERQSVHAREGDPGSEVGNQNSEISVAKNLLASDFRLPVSDTGSPSPRASAVKRSRSAGDDNLLNIPTRDAGLVILRHDAGTPDEIFCAFDCGPLGYLSIAAHGHADALAIELRCGGQPILVDPGIYTYTGTYGGEPAWREYFRSTAAHNTLELGGVSQSVTGGPFLWERHANCILVKAEGLAEDCSTAVAIGEHDGYLGRPFAGRHRRTVRLYRAQRRIEIVDEISALISTRCRLLFHLHPSLACHVEENIAHLEWTAGAATLTLPAELSWRAVCGSENPILGWYSPSYDVKVSAVTLLGEGAVTGGAVYTTDIDLPLAGRFLPNSMSSLLRKR